MSIIGTLQEHRHQLVHCDPADAATRIMTPDAHLEIVRKTGSSKNMQQHTDECKYMHIIVNSHRLTVQCTEGECVMTVRDQGPGHGNSR